jgi:hypothetical protein
MAMGRPQERKTGAQRRAARREGNINVTRAEAQAIIAGTTDPEVITRFADHPNKHIKAQAAYKLEKLKS